ncbi:MAG: DUF1501 domain-containing protein [Gemmataceae bacterium]|nr:DUF1501 domain-containing protein [Gemmataceae bacterium]
MLTLTGPSARTCDGVPRRSFLRVGAAAGLALPHLLQAAPASRHRSVIMVYLSGGISHQDTVDPKPDAPSGIRGEFRPIPTALPGVRFCETIPRLAAMADKLAVVRSVVGQPDEHSSFLSCAGFPMGQTQRDGKPHFGSVVARVQGPTDPTVPAFVDLFPTMQHKPYNSPGAGLLGRGAAGVRVDGQDLAVMKLRDAVADRKALLGKLDALRRDADSTRAMDASYRRAFDVLASSRLVEALDVSKESVRTRERYGRGSAKHLGDGAPMWNDQLLMARRLVEAGARVVTVAYGFWDTHGGHFKHMKRHCPLFDQGVSALVEDIHARGLDKDCTVVAWGEFGRTPKINKDAGRDHWARVNSAILAGGGMRVGQVVGSTDTIAAEARNDPVHYRDVLATVYRNLGIDPHAMVADVSGRPTPILPVEARPIAKLS